MLQTYESIYEGKKCLAHKYTIGCVAKLTESLIQNETDAVLSSLDFHAGARAGVCSSKELKPHRSDVFQSDNLQSLRKKEILILTARACTRADIAQSLGITKNTPASHNSDIYQQLSISPLAEATQPPRMLVGRSGVSHN